MPRAPREVEVPLLPERNKSDRVAAPDYSVESRSNPPQTVSSSGERQRRVRFTTATVHFFGASSASALSWPWRLYYFMFSALISLQIFWAATTNWEKRDGSNCEPIWWVLCLRYSPLIAAVVVHGLGACFCTDPGSTKDDRSCSSKGWQAAHTLSFFRALSTVTMFYTGLAKFDFAHCGFFMLGLWIALFGIHSQSIAWVSHLCRLLTFFVYGMNFPWVDEPGMWIQAFGVTGFSTCEDPSMFSYTWRTFLWPMLATFATTCWSKAAKERTTFMSRDSLVRVGLDEDVTRLEIPRVGTTRPEADGVIPESSQNDGEEDFQRYENIKHLCATGVLLATVFGAGIRSGSTILRAVTLVLAGIMLTWKRATLCGCRKYAMRFTRVWLVAIIVAKYCYKSSLFRVLFGTYVFSKEEMLNWLGDLLEWAPDYSPRDLLNDIGLVTQPPNFWSASGGAMSDILPELVALVAIGDLLRIKDDTDTIQADSIRLLVRKVEKLYNQAIEQHRELQPIAEWCRHHARLFQGDFNQTLRVVCITMVFWMGTYELSLFNFVYFIAGTTLTFRWGHSSSATCRCHSLFTDIFSKVVPLVHLTCVYLWKLEFWNKGFPDHSDGSIIPLERIETIFGCDAHETFTWIGLRGEVMRKVGHQYAARTSTYVPLVVMVSLAVYDWLSHPEEADGQEEAGQKTDEEADEEQKRAPAEEDSLMLAALATVRDKYMWLRDTMTDRAIIVPAFYALLIWTPVMRGQVDLVCLMYLFLLVCFTQSQREQDLRTRTCGSIVKSICHCISRYQMVLLSIVLCIRYGVYLGRPPGCDWQLTPPGHLITRNSTLRVWLGIANECVTDNLYYQPCAVEDLLQDYIILLFMACYTRWNGTSRYANAVVDVHEDFDIVGFAEAFFDTGKQLLIVQESGRKKHWHVHGQWIGDRKAYKEIPHADRKGEGQRKTRPVRVAFDKDEVGFKYCCKEDPPNVVKKWHISDEQIAKWHDEWMEGKADTRSALKRVISSRTRYQTGKSDVLRYGNSLFEHLQCLFWHSGGVFVIQTSLLYLMLCHWSGADVSHHNDASRVEKQGTSIWMCLTTWLILRTFRHDDQSADSGSPNSKLLVGDAKTLFRLACGTMLFYAITQPPLGTHILEWAHWTFQTNCETRVWKALMILVGVPVQTIELKSPFGMDTSYLTMLAATALFALSFKTILRQPKRLDVMAAMHDQYKHNMARKRHVSDNANFIRKITADKELTPRGRDRSASSTAEAPSAAALDLATTVFEDVCTKLQNSWIDTLIHEQDSNDVLEKARAVSSQMHDVLEKARAVSSQMQKAAAPDAKSRGAKLLAQIILGTLMAILLFALGSALYSWAPLIGSIYSFVLLPFVVLVCASCFVVVRFEEHSKTESQFMKKWVSSVLNSEPQPECCLGTKTFEWLAKLLDVDLQKDARIEFQNACTPQNRDAVSIDEFVNWYERYATRSDCRQKLTELKYEDQKKLVKQALEAQLAQTSVVDHLPGFLKAPAKKFDGLANILAFALANLLGIARMCWFVLVGQSLQLCCTMICVGFIAHRDFVSCALMTSLFGYYFVAATGEAARCKFWCSAIDLLQLRMLTAQLVTALPPFVLVMGCLGCSIGFCLPPRQPRAAFVQSLLPPALLVIGLQGLLGALVWPAIALLATLAYLGAEANPLGSHNEEEPIQRGCACGDVSASAVFGIIVLLFAVSIIGSLFFVLATFGLWWGTIWVAVVCTAVCARSLKSLLREELGKPEMCFAYTLFLALFWCCVEMIFPLVFGGDSQTDGVFSLQTMCGQLYQPDGTECLGHVLDVVVSAWDIVLFLVLLLHRHRLRRRGEWSDKSVSSSTRSLALNSDLKDLSKRPFSLVPPNEFWDRALLNPLKQHIAVWIQDNNHLKTVLGVSFSTWTMVSVVCVLVAASLGMMCVFDDVPVGLHENTGGGWGSIQWTGQQNVGSCLSTSMTYLKVLAIVILFFSAAGLMSWTAGCDLKSLDTEGTRIELGADPDNPNKAIILPIQTRPCLPVQMYGITYGLGSFSRQGLSKKQLCQILDLMRSVACEDRITVRRTLLNIETYEMIRVRVEPDKEPIIEEQPPYVPSDDVARIVAITGPVNSASSKETLTRLGFGTPIEEKKRDDNETVESGSASDDDGYVPILCWQLVALPLVLALYFEETGQSASQISQSAKRSSTVPTSIVALGCGVFVLIIVDRAVYMLESSTCKLLMLWASLLAFCAFWITSDSGIDAQPGASESQSSTGSWSVWLMIACSMYFYYSAVQLERKLKRSPGRRFTRYEKVPGDKNTWVHTLRTPIRKAPFLMELVYLIDWQCTRTGLSLARYIRVEEIYTTLYEKQEQELMENEKKAKDDVGAKTALRDTKPFEQTWKVSARNERCRWCCGLVMLVIVLWGPLFAYSSSDLLGQRKSARVEGVHIQLDVRAVAGDCNRPDPDGCTVDTYTLWSTTSAKLRGITSAADMYGPFQSTIEQSNRATSRIQRQLDQTYTYDQFQLLMIGINNASSGWSITSHARDEFLNALGKPPCEEGHAAHGCTSLSSRLSYTFSRTNASLQEDISGSTGWQAVQRHNKKNLYSLVKQISDGHTEQKSMKSVKGIVKYPLYLGLPATGDVRADIVRSDIAGLSLQKTVDLSWSYDGLSSICRNDQAGSPPPDQTCAAGDVYRNASLGADLGWFTLKSSCPLGDTDFQGLCFILANDKIAAAGNELTSTLLASADSLGLVGFYTIAVLWIGNYIRRLLDGEVADATQRRIHHDPDSVKALMRVCKDLMAARSALDFEKEQRIYDTYLASGKHAWDTAEAMKQGDTPMADAPADATEPSESAPYCTQTRGRNFLHVLFRPPPGPFTNDVTDSCEPEPEPDAYGIGESIEVGQTGAIL